MFSSNGTGKMVKKMESKAIVVQTYVLNKNKYFIRKEKPKIYFLTGFY